MSPVALSDGRLKGGWREGRWVEGGREGGKCLKIDGG